MSSARYGGAWPDKDEKANKLENVSATVCQGTLQSHRACQMLADRFAKNTANVRPFS